MATLTGTEIKNSYQGLLKTDDNAVITASLKTITDGEGTLSALSVSTAQIKATDIIISSMSASAGQTVIVGANGLLQSQTVAPTTPIFTTGSGPNSIKPVLGNNSASGNTATIGGGRNNCVSGECSTIGGGWCNTSAGNSAAVGGGYCNNSAGNYSAVGGGYLNNASAPLAVISGGMLNLSCSIGSTIGGGGQNNAIGEYSTISGGRGNRACGYASGIFAGEGNTTRAVDANSFIIGVGLTSTASNYTFVNNICNVGGGTSDERLKEDIKPLTIGLNELSQLEPISYNFKVDDSKAIKYGFLAQCVHKIIPELALFHPTETVDGDKVLQFEKDAIWSSIINAIKELKQRLETLENK